MNHEWEVSRLWVESEILFIFLEVCSTPPHFETWEGCEGCFRHAFLRLRLPKLRGCEG